MFERLGLSIQCFLHRGQQFTHSTLKTLGSSASDLGRSPVFPASSFHCRGLSTYYQHHAASTTADMPSRGRSGPRNPCLIA